MTPFLELLLHDFTIERRLSKHKRIWACTTPSQLLFHSIPSPTSATSPSRGFTSLSSTTGPTISLLTQVPSFLRYPIIKVNSMGGKVWTEKEEQVFWEAIVPLSSNAADPTQQSISWDECAELMQQRMGDQARRVYTSTMLYEHHYQSIKLGNKPAKARGFITEHLRQLDWYKDEKNSGRPCPPTAPPPQEPNQENEDLLAMIIAKDPAAKQFVRNKPLARSRGQTLQAQPNPVPGGRCVQSQTAAATERYELPSTRICRAIAARGFDIPSPSNVPIPAPTRPIPMTLGPQRGYGYPQARYQDYIDPALTSDAATVSSGFLSDHVPGLSTSASSNSTVGSTMSGNTTVTRQYRAIAPAPPAYGMERAIATPIDYVQQDVGQRQPKRLLSVENDVEISPPKRLTLSTASSSHPTVDPRLQQASHSAIDPRLLPTTHWQHMGFRDEPRPTRTPEVSAPLANLQPLRPLLPAGNVWKRATVNTNGAPETVDSFLTSGQYGRIRYRGEPNELRHEPEAPWHIRDGYYSQTTEGAIGGGNAHSERGRYEREWYRED
ncbi:hypothetical protein B0J13DRAFT_256796 [Dactylonectria estremocensis]|uniref:Uncharacterized protein n=1 Tax=Dactylonectria estremocensis TaxID=1079267 RepID=A0A9P9F0D0_9HYPO|nr:hypothetical protein B0J13DRAFT_256796 [Dactylonectria estremocensis]